MTRRLSVFVQLKDSWDIDVFSRKQSGLFVIFIALVDVTVFLRTPVWDRTHKNTYTWVVGLRVSEELVCQLGYNLCGFFDSFNVGFGI